MPPSDGQRTYAVGDVILAQHTDKLHEAKVLQVGDGSVDGEDLYVHFVGWNKKHDMWYRLEHTRPITPETRAEQERMKVDYDKRVLERAQRRSTRQGASTTVLPTPATAASPQLHHALSHSFFLFFSAACLFLSVTKRTQAALREEVTQAAASTRRLHFLEFMDEVKQGDTEEEEARQQVRVKREKVELEVVLLDEDE